MGRPGRRGLPLTHPVDQQDAQKPTPWLVRLGGMSAWALRDQWVWFSSPESFERGQRSVLAAVEIPLAIGLFWGGAAQSPWPLMTLIGLLAAPLLLLRSPEAIARGVELLQRYWEDGEGLGDLWHDRIETSVWRDISDAREALEPALSALLLFGIAFLLLVANKYANVGVVIATGGFIVAFGGIVIVVAIAVLGAGLGVVAATTAIAVGIACVGLFFWAGKDIGDALPVGVMAGFVVLFGSIILGLPIVVLAIALRRSPPGTNGNPFLILCYVLGVFLRSLALRIGATLRELPAGLKHYAANCRESILVIDFLHVPELMPQASTVSSELDLASYWRRTWSAMQAQSWRTRWAEWTLKVFFALLIYLPALAYRLNLKANAWLWGLIAWVFSPARWPSEERQRESTRFWIGNPPQAILACVLLPMMLWLIWSWVWTRVPADAFKDYRSWFDLWPAPVGSLRYASLCVLCVALAGLLIAAYRVSSTHGKALESANDFANYPPEAKARALLFAGHVRRWLMACTAFSVLTAWVFLLWAAVNRTERYKDVVWGWLKPLL